MSATQVDEAVEQAKQLVSLFERKMITEGSLVGGIASQMTTENFQSVLKSLPASIRGMMRCWAKSLPDSESRGIVFWPLKNGVELSFKEWLREQESCENGAEKS